MTGEAAAQDDEEAAAQDDGGGSLVGWSGDELFGLLFG
jgi:hypothetical protein